MSVRQYIGARYVTKIYENSLDSSSAEWESGVTYEPLTLVTYLNSSYLSKKEVPGSVGDPAANPDYWVVTGAYNGQIMQLQADIQDINDRIDTLNTEPSRVIVIADSYALGRGGQTPFTTTLQTLLGLSNSDYFVVAEGAMGFVQTGENGHTGLTLLQSESANITDHDTISDILVTLGLNDLQQSYNDICSAISAFCAYCRTEYPTARLHFGYIGNENKPRNGTNMALFVGSVKAVIDSAHEQKAHYINNIEFIMHNGQLFISDNVHPTTAAGNILARQLLTGLYGHDANYIAEKESVSVTGYGGNGVTGSVQSWFENGIGVFRIALDLGSGLTLSGNTWHQIADVSTNAVVMCQAADAPICPVYCIDTSNNYHLIFMRYYNGTIEANAFKYGSSVTLAGSTVPVQTTVEMLRS